MLIYSKKLKQHIIKNFINKVLINRKQYYIKGSFNRKIPYVTDIDIVNVIYPQINDKNIYEQVISLIKRLSLDDSIIVCYINFGYDNRFILSDCSNNQLNSIRLLLNDDEKDNFNKIVDKYTNDYDKMKFFLTEFLKPLYKLKWTIEEVLSNQKQLRNNVLVTFTELIILNIYIIFKFFFKIKTHVVGSDLVVQYKKQQKNIYSDAFNYYVQFSNYNNEYFWMLYLFRQYFQHKNKTLYSKLYNFTEIKCGMYKQMLITIETYQILHKYYKLTIDLAKILVTDLISSCHKLIDFYNLNSFLINKIVDTSTNSNALTKINTWYFLLDSMYDKISNYMNKISEKQFYYYLNKIEPSDRQKFYLTK